MNLQYVNQPVKQILISQAMSQPINQSINQSVTIS